MTRIQRLMLLAAWILITNLQSFPREIKIVSSPDLRAETIAAGELKSLFLLQRRTLRDGTSIEPVLQKPGAVHEAFLKEYLGRDGEEIRAYYQGLVFTGKASMPREMSSDAEMVAYVARTRGAIGYVSGGANTDSVKVLTVAPESFRSERILLKRVEPEYPKELQQRGIAGTVRLALTVSPRGSVEDVRVMGGNPILAEAAEKAAKEWVYSPSATRSTIEVSIAFAVRP
jgi:TonB family protein